ncbi:MAG: undecaprenyldiphospho-muramoylpentapeptide beta-N-acetylglucosaminyltransferase [Verrucomicrobiota bacterium]|jgi:UDP-N-acetylglucosamine--N-acetylmuramyl-(pentapeptide) pyrophosphoryl-undecaprenol N-acetylglucosamine transferase
MKPLPGNHPHVAIACGGTGGHLFPGLAVGRELVARGARVTLLISPKEVDQAAVQGLDDLQTATLPAVGLQGRNYGAFLLGFARAWQAARRHFLDPDIGQRPPDAVLGMGGFTAAPPMMAGRQLGAATFLHESNTIPGRANRLMARWTRECFTGFDETAALLGRARVTCTGTPVRETIARLRRQSDPQAAKASLGLDPTKPVLLITGGSQGARGLNQWVCATLPRLAASAPDLQFIHLSGTPDLATVQAAHHPLGRRSWVRPFLQEMHLALEAADGVISRAGASSLAELAALRIPSILVPLPTAQDNHQFHNANALARCGAAVLMSQAEPDPEKLHAAILSLLDDSGRRASMQRELGALDRPEAATVIAQTILEHLRQPFTRAVRQTAPRAVPTTPRWIPFKEAA